MIAETIPINPRVTARATVNVPHQESSEMDEEQIRSSHNYDGIHIREYKDGRILILIDPSTHDVNSRTSGGERGNTRGLRQVIEITHKPASGTQILERANAPTKYDLKEEL